MDEGRVGNPAQAARRRSVRRAPRRAGRLVFAFVLLFLILYAFPPPPGVDALPTPSGNVGIDPGPADARSPALAVDASGTLHVVRYENKSTTRGIYYARSTDAATWSASVRIDDASVDAFFPRIAVEREPVGIRGRIYVAYQASAGSAADAMFSSSDDGLAWTPPRRLDNAPAGNASIAPAIAASAVRVYAVWSDARDPSAVHVYFRASLDGGASWGAELRLSTFSASNLQARIDAKADTVVVAWRQALASGPAIAFARSDDAGATWRRSYVSMAPGPSYNLLGGDVFLDDLLTSHVSWVRTNPSGESHVLYAWSGDGSSWSSPVRVDDTAISATMRVTSVAGLAGTIWVAWDDNRAGEYDTYASWSTDGRAWGDGLMDGIDLRLDDTDRNGFPADDATQQVGPVLRTGSYGVYAVWEDLRAGTWDVFATSVQVSPLVITEVQDEPAIDARVEVYNFGATAFDFTGTVLLAGSATIDLSPLGTRPARSHVSVGTTSGDLVGALDLGTEGALVQVRRGADVLASAGTGRFGVGPDSLAFESSSRFAGTLDYVGPWTRAIAPTFGTRNLVPPPDLAPPVVLNELLFNPSQPGERFVELFARGNADLTGYRLIGDSVFTFSGGTIGGASLYAFLSENVAPTWWSSVDASGDNVYLYDAAGRLLDMFGWSTPHAAGRSAMRVNEGGGGLAAFDDPSATANGWAFDAIPSLALVGLASDSTIFADIGTTVQFLLIATNRQAVAETVNIGASGVLTNWPVNLLWTNGTPLTDSPGDADVLPDLGALPGGGSAPFLVEVRVPIEAPLGDGNVITAFASAAAVPAARATADLTINLYPHFDILRTVDPQSVYLEGSGAPYNEVTQIGLTITGAGFPVVTAVPQDVVFQIDVSGSMNTNDPSNLRTEAVKSYIDGMRVDDRASVIGFSNGAWVVNNRPLTYTTPSGKIALEGDADTLACSPACAGATNIDDALQLGNDWLIMFSDRTRTRVEILLTDGECTVPPGNPCPNTNAIATQAANEDIVIYTIGLGPNVDRAYLENIANRTGGKFYFANTPQDLLQIYAEIGTRINRTAGVDPDPTDATPMVEDHLAPWLNIVPNSFFNPLGGTPRPPEFQARLGDRTILQWNISRLDINESWSVRFSVTSTRLGLQDVALHPDARVAYLRWDGSNVYQTIPQAQLEVLRAPSPPMITATLPSAGATGVSIDQPIRIAFSEAMDAPTVQWTITPAVTTTPSWTTSDLLALDHPDLAECTLYTVHVTAGFDLDGEGLAPGPVPNPWSFTTLCPLYVAYTISRLPLTGDVLVDGAPYPIPARFVWREGSVHRIEALDLDPFAASRLAFLSWDDEGARDHSITVGAVDLTIIATYRLQHPATIALVGLPSNRPARVDFTVFSAPGTDAKFDVFTGWVDDGSALDVEPLVSGIPGERFITRDPASWTVTAPLSRAIRYGHQFTANVAVTGLDGNAVSIDFTSFLSPFEANTTDAWNAWVDANSQLRVDDVLTIGNRERYRTLDDTHWQVDAPLDVAVTYIHQFRPRVTLLGTDGEHTVGVSSHLDRQAVHDPAVASEWFAWTDAGTSLAFDAQTTGTPPRTAQDPTTFSVGTAFDAMIRYQAPAPPSPESNWKPFLALVYAIGLLVAGFAAGSRALDRYVPVPKGGDVDARRKLFAKLTLGQKLERLSLAEIGEKAERDRRFTRAVLAVPFAVLEAGIGAFSLLTGVFRIPEDGNWLPIGFFANTAVLATGLLVDLAIRRRGYRMSEDDLLRLAEIRERRGDGRGEAAPAE